MGNQSSNSHDIYARHVSSSSGVRPGVAKDQLIFIIICAVAVTVAAVALVHSFSRGAKVPPSTWQCVDCGNELKKAATPPVTCAKCGGQAAKLIYRDCPDCGTKVLFGRTLTQSQPEGTAKPAGGQPGMGMGAQVVQYWVQQEDGSFAWSPWMSGMSPQARKINDRLNRTMVCPECDVVLSTRQSR